MTMISTALSTKLFYATPAPASRLVTHDLQIVPQAYVVAAPESLQPSLEALSSSVTSAVASPSLPNRLLPIPNPFKPKMQDQPSTGFPKNVSPGRVILGSALNFGQIPTLRGDSGQKGMQVWTMNGQCVRVLLWGCSDFLVKKNNFILLSSIATNIDQRFSRQRIPTPKPACSERPSIMA